MQGGIFSSILEILKCDMFEGENQKLYYIHSYLSEKCYTQNYYNWLNLTTIPIFVIYAFFFPLLAFLYIYRAGRYVYDKKHLIFVGFILNGYKSRNKFWEFWFFIRKIIFNLGVVFFEKSVASFYIILIFFISIYLQHDRRPFLTKRLNKLELENISSSLFILVLSLFSENVENKVIQGFCISLMFLINCVFLLKVLYIFLNLKLSNIAENKKNKLLEKILKNFLNSFLF